jgi:DNA-directed RNA polymerase subunit RPC12/RpoP
MVIPHEFICADCKAHVFSFGGGPNETRCATCDMIRLLKLPPDKEKAMRVLLDVEIPESDDA